MLRSLRLRDVVIVDAADLEVGPGFTVLTGETGAGKSILLDALGLALGARADAGIVREGAARADVTAEFDADPALEAWLAERELAGDPGVVQLRRTVDADGRSRATVNGQPATAALLREIGERLVDVHGQHAAQSLVRGSGQRDLLDAYAGVLEQVRAIGRLHAEWRATQRALEEAEVGGRALALERDRLQWQLEEIDALALGEHEWADLNAEQRRLAHAASLIDGTRGAADALADDDEAIVTRLQRLAQRLRPLVEVDPRIGPALELIDSAAIQAGEAAATLADLAARLELDPARLQAVDERIGRVFAAARKLRIAPEALVAEREALRARLAQLAAAGDVEALQERARAARAAYDEAASRLTVARRRAAATLAEGVTAEIGRLGMAGGRLEVAVEPGEPGPAGCDQVEFRVAGHAGASLRPVGKVASGGELSRIGLAIAVLAAQANPVPTLIFDEADAGVGGAVAEVIGELMRRLGETRQVLCVTHLAQVAAKADHHYAVAKQQRSDRTTSLIERLDRGRRVEEIARMLGGLEITATTRRHARELLG